MSDCVFIDSQAYPRIHKATCTGKFDTRADRGINLGNEYGAYRLNLSITRLAVITKPVSLDE